MTQNNAPIPWKHILRILTTFAPLWLGAALLFGGLGVTYAMLRSDTWSAGQPLVVRNGATGSHERMGRFGSQEELKAAQETVLEMAKHRDVVRDALQRIGPPQGTSGPSWPTTRAVALTAKERVIVRPPKGSEFGHTEVIYLEVEAESPERAKAFCASLFQSLSDRLRKVRQVRADSVVKELGYARDLAKENLHESAEQLRTIEVAFGSDLGELRSLSDSVTFDGTNRRVLDETLKELQAAELELDAQRSLHELLLQGRENPQKLLVSGGELLSTQPSLLRLKDGLIDAQLKTSQLSGIYTSDHPRLRAALQTEAEIRPKLQLEASSVVEATRPVLHRAETRVKRLEEKRRQLDDRLAKLASVRTKYAELSAEVEHRTDLLEQAEAALSEAQANHSAASSTSLVAELGPPLVNDSPEGPSASLLSLGATVAGLIFGLGAVFLIAPGPSGSTWGRRWSDAMVGRRAADVLAASGTASVAATPPVGTDRRRNARASGTIQKSEGE